MHHLKQIELNEVHTGSPATLRKKGQHFCQGARWPSKGRQQRRGLSCCECKQPLYGKAIEQNECLVGVHWRVVAMVISA